MRRHEILFRLLRIPLEAAIVFAAFYLAREIRLVTDLIPNIQLPIQRISESALFGFALSGSVLYVLVFAAFGLYRLDRGNDSGIETFGRIVSASFSWFLYYVAAVYLSAGYLFRTDIPRLVIFFTLFLSIFAVVTERFLLGWIRGKMLSAGKLPARRVLVLTATGASPVLEEVSRDPEYAVVAFANSKPFGPGVSGDRYLV